MTEKNFKNALMKIIEAFSDEEIMQNALQQIDDEKIKFKRDMEDLAKSLAIEKKQSKIDMAKMFNNVKRYKNK